MHEDGSSQLVSKWEGVIGGLVTRTKPDYQIRAHPKNSNSQNRLQALQFLRIILENICCYLGRENVKQRFHLSLALFTVFLMPYAFAQANANSETAACTFDDGTEISIRYTPVEYKKGYEIPNGKPWAPNDVQMLLFTPTDVVAGNTTIPTGAYSMYILRNKTDWTLIVSRNIKEGSPYDKSQDVARIPMGTGKVSSPRNTFSANFGHIAPKTCSIQIYFGDTGAFGDFLQK
jgi:hypothetical protein